MMQISVLAQSMVNGIEHNDVKYAYDNLNENNKRTLCKLKLRINLKVLKTWIMRGLYFAASDF